MPDTRRPLSELQSLLADNVAKLISPQRLRDFLLSVDCAAHVVTITASNYTISADDGVILANATSNAISATLPAASGSTDRIIYIKKIDSSANIVTILPTGSDKIDGNISLPLLTINLCATLISNGTNWYII